MSFLAYVSSRISISESKESIYDHLARAHEAVADKNVLVDALISNGFCDQLQAEALWDQWTESQNKRGSPDSIAGGGRIGDFRICSVIGSGGFGHVYLAEKDHKRYAVKVIKDTLLANPVVASRFAREAEALKKCRGTEHVVELIEYGIDRGSSFIVMEYMTQGDVGRVLQARNGGLAEEQALRIILGAAQGVHELHSRGIVHRDIKPSNIFMNELGDTKIGDLGILRSDNTIGDGTGGGSVMGTYWYMAPEQIRGEATARSDIYALAATLYALLAGHPPFSEEPHVLSLVTRKASSGIPDVSLEVPAVSGETSRLIQLAGACSPEGRHAHVRAFIDHVQLAIDQITAPQENVYREWLSKFDSIVERHVLSDACYVGKERLNADVQGWVRESSGFHSEWRRRAGVPSGLATLLATLIDACGPGTDFEIDEDQIRVLHGHAVGAGRLCAMWTLTECLARRKRSRELEQVLLHASAQGSLCGQTLLGARLIEGDVLPRDFYGGVYWLEKAMQHNSVHAMLALAKFFACKDHNMHDQKRANSLALTAEENQSTEAMVDLALGFSQEREDHVALSGQSLGLMERASKGGHPAAQLHIGRKMRCENNYESAISLLQSAHKGGIAVAANELTEMNEPPPLELVASDSAVRYANPWTNRRILKIKASKKPVSGIQVECKAAKAPYPVGHLAINESKEIGNDEMQCDVEKGTELRVSAAGYRQSLTIVL